MKDGIIKGQGNSRLLKAPETIPATFAEFRTALINGTLPVDVLFNAIGWDVVGTALNKANLLTDAVAAALGLTSDDPTVNEAINALLAAATQVVTQTKNGRMSAADKIKLDGVANSANNYVHPTGAGYNHIPSGGSVDSILGYSASGLAIWIQQLAQKSLLSAGTAAMYGLSGADANVDNALTVARNLTYSTALVSNATYNSNNVFVDLLSLTLPAGKYLVFANLTCTAADGSSREVYFDAYFDGGIIGALTEGTINSQIKSMYCIGIANLTTANTIKLRMKARFSTFTIYADSYIMGGSIVGSKATQLTAIKLA